MMFYNLLQIAQVNMNKKLRIVEDGVATLRQGDVEYPASIFEDIIHVAAVNE